MSKLSQTKWTSRKRSEPSASTLSLWPMGHTWAHLHFDEERLDPRRKWLNCTTISTSQLLENTVTSLPYPLSNIIRDDSGLQLRTRLCGFSLYARGRAQDDIFWSDRDVDDNFATCDVAISSPFGLIATCQTMDLCSNENYQNKQRRSASMESGMSRRSDSRFDDLSRIFSIKLVWIKLANSETEQNVIIVLLHRFDNMRNGH